MLNGSDPITEAVAELLPLDLGERSRRRSKPIVCGWCRGTGRRRARRRFDPESWSRVQTVECGACSGRGTV